MPIIQALKQKFHLNTFRLGQKEIIQSVLEKRDVMAVMPTGGGKSLCFQLPAYLQSGITIVISPLIALMNDQVKSLKKLGLNAECIHSALNLKERKAIFQNMAKAVQNKQGFILYLSPERIQKQGFIDWLPKQPVNLFAIDESHCVSQWGHDFRKEYSQISILRKICPNIPIIALTATATPQVISDIKQNLQLNNPDQHVYGFYRPNLYYQVEFCTNDDSKESFVLQALKQHPQGRILIYSGTRKKTEEWAQVLKHHHSAVGFYHAGLSAEQRQKIEEQYQTGEIRILTATNAFGMGIDHPDVRLVIHTQMPGNIESYYQEIGRAGRDGQNSTCLLLYSRKDKGLRSFFIRESDANSQIKKHRWQALNAIVQYSEGGECRHGDILTYFRDQQRLKKCGHCDSCAPQSDRKIHKPHTIEKPKTKLRKKNKQTLSSEDFSSQELLRIETLRNWRREYAQEHDIPAFIVFSDKTLKDLAIKAPSNPKELIEVYGLGEKKVQNFGHILLEKISTTKSNQTTP